MKLLVYILNHDKTLTFKKLKQSDIVDSKFKIGKNEYVVTTANIFIREMGFPIKKQKRYMMFTEGIPEAIPMPTDEKVTQMLLRTKVVRDFLAPDKQDYMLTIIMLIMGLLAGMLIMAILYPHIFLLNGKVAPIYHGNNTTILSIVRMR